MGMNLNVEYAPSVASADAGDGAVGGVVTQPDGTSLNFAITNSSLVDGLEVGVGYGETEYDLPSTDVATGDTQSTVGYANYSFGPVTVGIQQNYTSNSVNANGVSIGANEATIMGVAFNVNENLSVSYNDYENKYLKRGSQGDVTQDMDGVQIAYTMGGATLRISDASVTNAGGTTANSEDRTEVSLLMAF